MKKVNELYCNCVTWARLGGRLTNHHPDCSNFKEVIFAKVKNLETEGYFIQPMNEMSAAFDGEFDGAEAGNKWEVELVKMTQEEFDALPEFTGH